MNHDDFVAAVAAGRKISFSPQANNVERGIEAAWLQEAILSPVNSIVLDNAIVNGEVDVDSINVSGRVELRNCDISVLRIRNSTVEKFFDLGRSRISVLNIRGTTFLRGLRLRATSVGGPSQVPELL